MHHFSLLTALALATGPTPPDRGFAASLQAALASGEWSRVAPLFPRQEAPALGFLKQRWHEIRAGKLDPQAWEVEFKPYYQLGTRLGGRLHVTARAAGGKAVEGRFDLELAHRGSGWVAGEPLDVAHSEVRVTAHNLAVDLRGGKLAGADTLTLEPDGPDHRVFLRLGPGFKLAGATVGDQPWPAVQVDEVIYFQAPEGDGPQQVRLSYTGDLPVKAPEGQLVLPVQTGWYPHPADGAFARFQLTAVVPPGLEASAAGVPHAVEQTADRWTHLWTADQPIAGESVFAGRLDRLPGEGASPRLSALVPGENKGVGVDLLETARAAANFYGAHYGPPAGLDLAIVQVDAHPELASAAGVPVPAAALVTKALAHEVVDRGVAQAWIANARYEGTALERRFMTQGAASYMTLLYHAQRGGAKAFREGLAEAKATLWEALLAPDDQPAQPALTADQVDARAVLVLHMLRHQVGNAAFDEGFRKLFAARGQVVTMKVFRQAFEQASGKVLEPFFQQWMGHDGIPAFELENVEVKAKGNGVYEVSGEVVQQAPAYFLQLPIVVTTDKQQILYEVPVRAQRTGFKLVARSKPAKLFVDPLHDVLAAPVEPLELESAN